MNAKVIGTGEIIYDVDEQQFDFGRYQVHGRTKEGESVFYDSDKVILLPKEFQSENTIDWEQRRYEIVKDLYVHDSSISAEKAIAEADEIIQKLKEKLIDL